MAHGGDATTERDYYELLGVARDARRAEIKKAFRALARELHPDVSERPGRRGALQGGRRGVRGALQPRAPRALRPLRPRGAAQRRLHADHFDFGNLGDLFSAFFGDDLFGGGGRRGAARGADVAAEIEIELVEAARGVDADVPFELAVACATCGGDGAEPGTTRSTCPTCGGAGRLQQVSRTVFGEFVRTPRARAAAAPAASSSIRARRATAPGRVARGAAARRRRSRPASTTASGSGSRARATPARPAARAGDLYVHVRVRPDERFVREGNDIFSTVDLTMTQAALGATVTVPTLDGDAELELEPGTQPGEVRVLRGRGMPVLQGFGRGDQRCSSTCRPEAPDDEQRAPARAVRAQRRRRDLPAATRASSTAEERLPLSRRRVRATVPPGEAEARARCCSSSCRRASRRWSARAHRARRLHRRRRARRGSVGVRRRALDDVEPDWADRWRAFHRPVRIGPLWIGPPWEAADAGALPVVIDPGRAFGTARTRRRGSVSSSCSVPAREPPRCRLRLRRALHRRREARLRPGRGARRRPAGGRGDPRERADNGVEVEVRARGRARDDLPAADIVVANVELEVDRPLAPAAARRCVR